MRVSYIGVSADNSDKEKPSALARAGAHETSSVAIPKRGSTSGRVVAIQNHCLCDVPYGSHISMGAVIVVEWVMVLVRRFTVPTVAIFSDPGIRSPHDGLPPRFRHPGVNIMPD